MTLFNLIIILFAITSVNSTSIGKIDLSKVTKAHEALSSYNFFLNRFALTRDQDKIKNSIKLVHKLHLNLLTELDQYTQQKKRSTKTLANEYKDLRLTNDAEVSKKLISLAKKIQLSKQNYLFKLIQLKANYQTKIDSKMNSIFMTHAASQSYWNKILAEIFTSVENVRINKKLSVVIQHDVELQTTNHFFSEIDAIISMNSSSMFRHMHQNSYQFRNIFPNIAKQIAQDRFIKTIPPPMDISKDVIKELRLEN